MCCFVTEEEGYCRVVTDDVLQIGWFQELACGIPVRLLTVPEWLSAFPDGLYRKQSSTMVRRISRLGRYDPFPSTCRARRLMAVRRAKVVEAALIHTSMPHSSAGRTNHGTRLPGDLGLAQLIPNRRFRLRPKSGLNLNFHGDAVVFQIIMHNR